MEPLKMTVSELNSNMKKLLDSRPGLRDIWIQGEISNFKRNMTSGHIYLTLKDEGGVLKACMFKSSAASLTFRPEDGMKVTAHGRVTVYEQGGSYQLYIDKMLPDGLGELYAAYNKLLEKLKNEGLFDEAHKKPIPKYPKRVGVITSDTGAAVRDIINVIKRRFRYADIILYPSKVQGEGAAENVCRGIEFFNREKYVDVIIAGRGGGSIEDLWAFNDEITARAIFKSEIPIISSVGHEIDFTIADFVADLRAPTPSAAAELAVPSTESLLAELSNINKRMGSAVAKTLSEAEGKISYAEKLLSPMRFTDRIDSLALMLDSVSRRALSATEKTVESLSRSLSVHAAKLDSLSPLAVLARGYAALSDEEGKTINSVSELKENMNINIRLSDGNAKAEIKEVS